jgi:hypothetical protein
MERSIMSIISWLARFFFGGEPTRPTQRAQHNLREKKNFTVR